MRTLILAAAAFCAAFGAAQAQEGASPDFFAQVVSACEQQTAQRTATRPDPATLRTYCECAMGIAREEFTPAEFEMFGRFGIARSTGQPGPTEQELRAFDSPAFAQRSAAMNARLQPECTARLMQQRGGAG